MTVVFFHAHPDDEAIFTGGTMIRLAAAGQRVVLVIATGGELGTTAAGVDPEGPLAAVRQAESRQAAALLGVARVEFLGYADSGLGVPLPAGCFATVPVDEVACCIAALLTEEGAEALVVYDDDGIYGHPDHVMVHQAGLAAAAQAGVDRLYLSTVDREYLHFVETHMVEEAKRATGAGDVDNRGLAGTHLGSSTVEITTTVDVRAVLATKRAAMAAHASQIPETAGVMRLPTDAFAAVYGYEWYVRRGPAGPLEELG